MLGTSLEFGSGSFVGQVLKDDNFDGFSNLPPRDQARVVGWADGCPIVEELTDPTNPNPNRGPEAMLNRYGEVNFWFGEIVRHASELKPELAYAIMAGAARKQGEKAGKYEPESIPNDYFVQMSPMGTPWGYALGRIFVEQLEGFPDNEPTYAKIGRRLERGLNLLDTVARRATDPIQFVVGVAQELALADADPSKVLKHLFSRGKLAEEGCASLYREVFDYMQKHAPYLREHYRVLKERGLLGEYDIIDFESFA